MEIGERTPALVQAEAVPRKELVRDREADVLERDIVDESPVRAVEERHGGQARRIAKRERPAEKVQGQPGVDHVFDDDDVPPFEWGVDVLQQAHAAILGAGVRGELHEIERVRYRKRAREVGEKDHARLERCDQDRVPPCVVAGELGAELRDTCCDLLPRQIYGADLAVLG